MLPPWADNIGVFREELINIHARSINHPDDLTGNPAIRVGILDSAYQFPPELKDCVSILTRRRFVDTDKAFTTSHGLQVFDLLRSFCPDSTFCIYQVVNENAKVLKIPIIEAVQQAINDDVDALNISVGKHQRNCYQSCAICQAVKHAIREGIVPVAGAGNQNNGGETIFCPAQVEDCIAVGGFVAECRAGERSCPSPGIPGPEMRPPFAYWIEKWSDVQYPEQVSDESFCSYDRCAEGKSCSKYREERLWEYNVSPANDKPDILAPVHYPSLNGHFPEYLDVGTSFATPIVCGSLAAVFGELFSTGVARPPAIDAKHAVKRSGVSVESGGFNKLDAEQTWENLDP